MKQGLQHSKKELLQVIEDEIAICDNCPELCEGRIKTVPGEGNPEARIVFVGEGPGKNEAEQGRPFVGSAGQLLDGILMAMSLDRSKIFIANTVKCRPPQNRVPTKEERANCRPYLDRQLDAIKPEWVVVLGSTASNELLGQNIEACRGQVIEDKDRGFKMLATYHPAAILWAFNPDKKKEMKLNVWNDLAPLREWLEKNP